MTAFSSDEITDFSRQLAERRAELLAEIRAKLAEARSEQVDADVTSSVDVGDRAFLDLASELDIAAAERDIRELREVEAAQERIASGTFGTCADCGIAIAAARLRAAPTAKRCSACQTASEQRQRNPLHRA
jgi:RNA polymerase-binding protein DksA